MVTTSAIPNLNLLPVRPKRRPDEHVYGWALRIASKLALGVRDFLQVSVGIERGSFTCVSTPTPAECERVARVLAERTASPYVPLVPVYGNAAFFPAPGRQRFLLRQKVRAGLRFQYCPACLQAGATLRHSWQFSFVTVCPEHGCLLVDRCGECLADIPLCRVELLRGDRLGVACRCGKDLDAAVADSGPVPEADAAAKAMQRALLAMLEDAERQSAALEYCDALERRLQGLETPRATRKGLAFDAKPVAERHEDLRVVKL